MKKRIQLGSLCITVLLLFCTSVSATEPDENLGDKHNPDQHFNVSDSNWHTMYFDPGITNIYITCNGVPPENSNEFQIDCKTPAVWASCSPNGPGGAAPQNICQCTSHASEQHSGQFTMYSCP